jgi:hypothetical protein
MTWTSSVPQAIDALVQAYTAAEEFAGVTVWDGPTVSKATPREMLAVGFSSDDAESDVDASSLTEGLAASPDRETYTIRCAAAVLTGSTDIAAARRRAYELYAAAGAVVARDPRLGGAVMRARLGTHTLTQAQTDRGAQAVVIFGIACDAFTGR